MQDVPLSQALLLWDPGFYGQKPAFAVRPLGHDDYYRYASSGGACLAEVRALNDAGKRLRLMIDAWHIVAFYEVPVELVREGLLVIPEYRDMIAYDCLPKQFQQERDDR